MFRRLAVAAAVATVALTSSASPALAADTWTIPHTATITVDGHGYGHGRGMSQYGAEYAARHGHGYGDILGYYYPGTTWGRATGSVRVWISDDLTNDVQVAARPQLVARKSGSSTTWQLDRAKPRADRWRIVPQGDRVSVLQYRSNGWHQFRKVRGLLEFSAQGYPIKLYTDSGSPAYRGTLRSVPSSTGNRITVNVLPLETYLRSVVPSETFASSWHQQTLRAQAVAARSYAVNQRQARRDKPYDLCDTEACQSYQGADVEYPSSDLAVHATARRIRTYQGEPAFAEFSASSGGWTTAGDAPYLRAMRDKWDTPQDKWHAWSVDFSDTEIEQAWPAVGDLSQVAIADRDGHGEWGGRAGTVTLTGSSGSVTMTGAAFAATLGLASPWVSLTVR